MTDKTKALEAELSLADLEQMIADKRKASAQQGFTGLIADAEKAGFTTRIEHAHNGGAPALRVDY